MNTQPKALEIADRCQGLSQVADAYSEEAYREAAAELRRLHAENASLTAALAASCDEARDQMWESGGGAGCSRALTAEFQRDALLKALIDLLARDEQNTCQHQSTHRGGVLWEICDDCGRMWADDQGGKPEWEDPKEWTQARTAIAAVEGEMNHV